MAARTRTWIVTTTVLGSRPRKTYRFSYEAQALMFADMLRRDGETCMVGCS